MKKILSNAIFHILPSTIVNIDNRCQDRLLSENNSPPPPRLFPFRTTFVSCNLMPGSCNCFFTICGHFDHGCLESSARSHCVYLQRRGKPVMKWSFLTKVENKNLKSFLQVLSAFGEDQWAKELGIQDYKLKLQCKRLRPEPE